MGGRARVPSVIWTVWGTPEGIVRSDRKVPVGPVLTPLAALLILALCSGGTFGSSESDVPTSFAVRIDYNHEFRGSCEPVTVTVQFQSEVMGGESPFRYVWDFGDGGTSSDSSPAHTYTSILVEYTITLVVTDANGSV